LESIGVFAKVLWPSAGCWISTNSTGARANSFEAQAQQFQFAAQGLAGCNEFNSVGGMRSTTQKRSATTVRQRSAQRACPGLDEAA
jgi:hypothetical protein